MNTTEQVLIEKIRHLPPQRLAEVEDFVDFLCSRSSDQRLTQAAAHASEASFAAVWDNDEDAAYDPRWPLQIPPPVAGSNSPRGVGRTVWIVTQMG